MVRIGRCVPKRYSVYIHLRGNGERPKGDGELSAGSVLPRYLERADCVHGGVCSLRDGPGVPLSISFS